MKERLKGILIGVLIATLLFGVTGTALAANGAINIDIYPAKILVNNEVFQPKDANGNDVMVFIHNGTTYAPLRALAEAYGLEVGWDSASGTASVIDPEKAEEIFPPTSTGGATEEALNRWMAGEVPAPYSVGINVIKIGDKYYENSNAVETSSRLHKITFDNDVPLIFARDISVNAGNECSSWELLGLMRQALMTEYTIEETENPFFDGKIIIESPAWALRGIVSAGKDSPQYISATTKYTPTWIEYDGVKIYNAPPHDGFYVKDGIRYYDGNVCVNDILAKLGINASFSITEYYDIHCIEWH